MIISTSGGILATGAFLWILPTLVGRAPGSRRARENGKRRTAPNILKRIRVKLRPGEDLRMILAGMIAGGKWGLLAPRIPDMVGGGMEQRMTALERAFPLATSGRVAGVTGIITLLNRDGYYTSQIEGRLRDNWRISIKAARNVNSDPPGTRSVDND